MTETSSIVFFHPDLGIGGAERLVIDAAVSLQKLGHRVTIFTSHCDPAHCFDEARDGTLDVRVRGKLLPATLFGRFKILFTILRQFHLLCNLALSGELKQLKPTAFFIDQLSAGIPLIRYFFPETRILFYCHYPDLLLVQRRQSLVKRLWRLPFDALEGWGMKGADKVVVNSGFTKGVVESVWPRIGGETGIGIVYPCVDIAVKKEAHAKADEQQLMWKGKKVILSINRFERKKDLGLAIRAFAKLDEKERKAVKLVIAGGYDSREHENVAYHEELFSLAESLKLKAATAKNVVSALSLPDDMEVLFLLSVSSQLKALLLKEAKLLLYTPTNEHFGIVPLEAMLAQLPVLAANTGGPLETIVEGKTGWHRDVTDVEAWTRIIQKVLFEMPETTRRQMGSAGKKRVQKEFSQEQMGRKIDEEIEAMRARDRSQPIELQDLLLNLGICMAVCMVISTVVASRR